jgi:hypothetical protein
MDQINNQLGQVLNAKQIAEYTGLDVKTIRKYYRELGGIRLGSRIVFFEKEFINAIQKRKELDCPGAEGRAATRENVPDEERGNGVGSRDEAKARKRLEQEDRHGLFG